MVSKPPPRCAASDSSPASDLVLPRHASERGIRIAAALLVAAGLAASGLAILAEDLGVGAEAARGTFGWKRITLLAVGAMVITVGVLLLLRPRVAFRAIDWERTRGLDREVRIAGALVVGAGLTASGLAILAEELGVGAEAAQGTFGWKRISLLAAGAAAIVAGGLLLAHPRIVSRHATSQRLQVALFVCVGLVLGAWLMLVARQVADGGFYSDDWGIQHQWSSGGYSETVAWKLEDLGSKPLLAIALPAPYAAFGLNPAGHHLLAAGLVLASVGVFYAVLRELRFAPRDAVPIALLALLFPWASAVRLWPTGSLNNLAVLLLFAGFLLALRGLRAGGRRGLAMHLVAAACYAASILTYETATVVALMLWPAYAWHYGWRPALPRAVLDVSAVVAAAAYSAANTVRPIFGVSEQFSNLLLILRDGAHLLAASIVPLVSPGELSFEGTGAILGVAFGFLAVVLARRWRALQNSSADSALGWVVVAAVALVVLVLCWAIYAVGSAYTPTQPGLRDRVNVLALYPAVVLAYAILRSAGHLIFRSGYLFAVAGCMAILIGYGVHDVRHQRDWSTSFRLQTSVLTSVERASPSDGSLVLTFGHPAEIAPGLPVFDAYWDLLPAARLRTTSAIDTFPVFEGSQLSCSPDGVTMDHLTTTLFAGGGYDERRNIHPEESGISRTRNYPHVVFVDAADQRHAVIQSPEHCANALHDFAPGPLLRPSP